mmetsp:Transcript_21174/g.44693  ORF Transcript_21174/g.44693 Transcript_21174/m.44693 type:complete len:278 (-) Transcript_21174:2479-3312(-)
MFRVTGICDGHTNSNIIVKHINWDGNTHGRVVRIIKGLDGRCCYIHCNVGRVAMVGLANARRVHERVRSDITFIGSVNNLIVHNLQSAMRRNGRVLHREVFRRWQIIDPHSDSDGLVSSRGGRVVDGIDGGRGHGNGNRGRVANYGRIALAHRVRELVRADVGGVRGVTDLVAHDRHGALVGVGDAVKRDRIALVVREHVHVHGNAHGRVLGIVHGDDGEHAHVDRDGGIVALVRVADARRVLEGIHAHVGIVGRVDQHSVHLLHTSVGGVGEGTDR